MKRLFGLVPLCILIAALLACGNSDVNTGTTSATPGSTATTNKHFAVKDTVKVGNDWEVVVNSVKTDPGSDYVKPTKGRFALVNVTLKNVSGKEQNLSSLLSFKFKDANGVSYTETILPGTAPSPNGKVEAGGKSTGDLVYDIPADQKAFTLSFDPDAFASGQTIWDITLP